ncbi:MAG: DUF5125 domain-containing protein [Bacteroidales bacterium]|nr:DUF5125 domain-containing protein [Bacteroidales bacterium]
MKYSKIIAAAIAVAAPLMSCEDEYSEPAMGGNPVLTVKSDVSTAYFGDSLAISFIADDASEALSTLKAQLLFGEEVVGESTVRTKVNGDEYSCKIYVPFLAQIPNGTATLSLVLENVTGKKVTNEVGVKISRPDYEYLLLIDEEGKEYKMTPNAEVKYQYDATDNFPQKMKATIKAPKFGSNGNELLFGFNGSSIVLNGDKAIPFANAKAGNYTISFNTFSFEGSPFITLGVNGVDFVSESETIATADVDFKKGEKVSFEGFTELEDWYIDPDYFTADEDGSYTFNAIDGTYRVIADSKKNYFRVYSLKNSEPATLNEDGSGALWIIGEAIGIPSVAANQVGWTTENALCMAQVKEKVYQITLIGGKTVKSESINFKFFGQMGWGIELGPDALTSTSDIVLVGNKETNGKDNGNLFLAEGKSLEANAIYVFTVDMTEGMNNAVLSVEKAGEVSFEAQKAAINGTELETIDNTIFTADIDMTQGQALTVTGLGEMSEWWMDPDYFAVDGSDIKFVPVNGTYHITANKGNKTIVAVRYDNGAPMKLNEETGDGCIYILGWGAGNPSLDNQFGWDNPADAYGMAQVAPAVYQFTAVAGPEKGSSIGQRIRYDYIGIKFFYQNGWGGEFGNDNLLSLAPGTEELVKVVDGGNIELAQNLEENATYVLTIDLTNGVTNGVLSVTKK